MATSSVAMQRVGPLAALPEALERFGISLSDVLEGSRVSPADLSPNNFLPLNCVCEILERAAIVTQCPMFGLYLGFHQSHAALGAVGMLMSYAPTLGDALGDFVSLQIRNSTGLAGRASAGSAGRTRRAPARRGETVATGARAWRDRNRTAPPLSTASNWKAGRIASSIERALPIEPLVMPSTANGIVSIAWWEKPPSTRIWPIASRPGALPMRPASQWPCHQLPASPQRPSCGKDGHGRASQVQTWLLARSSIGAAIDGRDRIVGGIVADQRFQVGARHHVVARPVGEVRIEAFRRFRVDEDVRLVRALVDRRASHFDEADRLALRRPAGRAAAFDAARPVDSGGSPTNCEYPSAGTPMAFRRRLLSECGLARPAHWRRHNTSHSIRRPRHSRPDRPGDGCSERRSASKSRCADPSRQSESGK